LGLGSGAKEGRGKLGENEPGKSCNGIAVALNFSISFNLQSTTMMPPQPTLDILYFSSGCGLWRCLKIAGGNGGDGRDASKF